MNRHFLVASDMDYTLLLPGREVSSANKAAAEKIRLAGGTLALSTGRSFYLTGRYIRDLGLSCPVIASNGACVYDPVGRKAIYSSLIDGDTAKSLLEIFIRKNTNATLYGPDGIYLMPGSLRGEFLYNYNKGLAEELKAPIFKLTSDDLKKPLPRFDKFLIIEPQNGELSDISQFEDLDMVSSAGGFYDVMNKGISKGTGLKMIAGYLNIDPGMTFAIGDSENDLSMLEASAHPIAMAGSDSRLLQAAEYITLTCAEDGFAKAVEEFILPRVQRE